MKRSSDYFRRCEPVGLCEAPKPPFRLPDVMQSEPCYPGRRIWLLLDEAPCYTAILSQVFAAQLDIVLVWLPKQCSELNAMDQLWKELKGDLAANRQFRNIAETVDYAEQWVLNLTDNQALQKAGVFSKSHWLKHF
jgi:DDE superfamily endonuclease